MRILVWFSCGAASAVAAKMAVDKYPDCEVLYCDTLAYEHPDNMRFLKDVEKWIGKEIKLLKSTKYTCLLVVMNIFLLIWFSQNRSIENESFFFR
jgi:hypothetical protein